MSKFEVKVIEITDIQELPTADRLELAFYGGWQVCVQKGRFKKGMKAVYIPIDSVLPEEVETKLFGEGSKIKLNKHRVRSIRIRSAISQGMIVKLNDLGLSESYPVGYDVKDELGIKKYEPHVKEMPTGLKTPKHKKYRNPYFRKYTDIQHLKYYIDVLKDKPVVISEKVHGCLNYSTRISLADGTKKTIGTIVKNKLDVEVLGVDSNGKIVPTKIINHYKNGTTNEWLKIKFERKNADRGNSFGLLICTKNHKLYNPDINKYVEACKFTVKDRVLIKRTKLHINFIQQEVLKGIILGDGSLIKNYISYSHKMKHKQYLEYTNKSLGNLFGSNDTDILSGYGTEMCRGRSIASYDIKEMFKDWFIYGTKQVPATITLSPISLAFWYMDDGTLSKPSDQNERVSLATCGFNEDSINNLLAALQKLDIKAKKMKTDHNKYWRIVINSDEAGKFFVLISPYICECMRYKLPERYRNNNIIDLGSYSYYKPDTIHQKIISIEEISKYKGGVGKYDIETETHNFFANDMLVHNSNFRTGKVKYNPYNFWKRILQFFRLAPKYEYCFGSRNVDLTRRGKNSKTYYKKNVYAEISDRYKFNDILKDGEVVYGEIYGPSIQKGYHYGLKNDEIDLVVYDVMKNGVFMDTYDAKQFCEEHNLKFVPILFTGIHDYETVQKLATGNSIFCPDQKVIEGVVIKTLEESRGYYGRSIFKYLNDEFLLNKNNTDWH